MIMKRHVLGEVLVGGNNYGFAAGDNDNVYVVVGDGVRIFVGDSYEGFIVGDNGNVHAQLLMLVLKCCSCWWRPARKVQFGHAATTCW